MMGRITDIRIEREVGADGTAVWRVDYEREERTNFLKVAARDEAEARYIALLALAGQAESRR